MAQEAPLPMRTTLAIAAAACSVTLAAGITVAAITGYLGPRPQAASLEPPGTAAAAAEAPSPRVVLVPVVPNVAPPADIAETGELRMAAVTHEESEEHHERAERRRGEDHDDDD